GRAPQHERARRNEHQVRRSYKHHRLVKPLVCRRGGLVGPKIRTGWRLEKLQATPGIRLSQIRDILDRVNGAHRPGDAQPRIQLQVQSRWRLGRTREWIEKRESRRPEE